MLPLSRKVVLDVNGDQGGPSVKQDKVLTAVFEKQMSLFFFTAAVLSITVV